MSQPTLRRYLLALGTAVALTGALLDTTAAQAQNLDQGKTAPRLFADTCSACHRSPRGLAKGRYRFTLMMFLKEHYSTSSNTASELADYLASVDVPQGGPPRAGAKKPPRKPRPPAEAPANPN
jgi:mono/diheme cytochrome c family protein